MKPYYSDPMCSLYLGDSYELSAELSINSQIAITDPPYLIETKGGGIAAKRDYLSDIKKAKIEKGFDFDHLNIFENWFCFCGKNQLVPLLNIASNRIGFSWALVCWNKTNPTPLCNQNYLPDVEYIIHSYKPGRLFGEYKDKSRFYTSRTERVYSHPTSKPDGIMTKLISLGTNPGEIVFDGFAGTGSSLVAAKRLGRYSIGIDNNERWLEIAAQRLQQDYLL